MMVSGEASAAVGSTAASDCAIRGDSRSLGLGQMSLPRGSRPRSRPVPGPGAVSGILHERHGEHRRHRIDFGCYAIRTGTGINIIAVVVVAHSLTAHHRHDRDVDR